MPYIYQVRQSAAIRVLLLVSLGQGELKARWLEFEFLTWLSCPSPGKPPAGAAWWCWSSRAPPSYLCRPFSGHGGSLCWSCPGCDSLEVVKCEVALSWAVQKGSRDEDGDGSCHGCTGHCLPFLSLFCSACMSLSIRHRLSLYCSLRQGYYIQSSWGIVSTNQQVAILYLSFVEVREARLHTYWNVWVRHRIFCSLFFCFFFFNYFLSLNCKDPKPVKA